MGEDWSSSTEARHSRRAAERAAGTVSEPVFLGSQRVCRSAHAEKTAMALTIYLGVCERDNRPVRFEYPLDMGPAAQIPCPECTLPVAGERLHAVTTTLTC